MAWTVVWERSILTGLAATIMVRVERRKMKIVSFILDGVGECRFVFLGLVAVVEGLGL